MMLSFGDGPTPGNESDLTDTNETHASNLSGLIKNSHLYVEKAKSTSCRYFTYNAKNFHSLPNLF